MNCSLAITQECEMWKFMTRRFEKQTLLSIEAAKKFKGVGSLDTIGRIQLPSIPSTAKLNSIIELQSQSITDTLHNKHHSSRQNLRTPKLSPLPLPEDGKKKRRRKRQTSEKRHRLALSQRRRKTRRRRGRRRSGQTTSRSTLTRPSSSWRACERRGSNRRR